MHKPHSCLRSLLISYIHAFQWTKFPFSFQNNLSCIFQERWDYVLTKPPQISWINRINKKFSAGWQELWSIQIFCPISEWRRWCQPLFLAVYILLSSSGRDDRTTESHVGLSSPPQWRDAGHFSPHPWPTLFMGFMGLWRTSSPGPKDLWRCFSRAPCVNFAHLLNLALMWLLFLWCVCMFVNHFKAFSWNGPMEK